ncbi:hypothetical protein [Arthrobacter sp. MDT1-65]
MTTRLLVPIGMLSISLGILGLFAGARGFPLLLIAVGGVVLALPCFHRGGDTHTWHSDDGGTAEFSMPPVGSCSPERLREARLLAARVVASSRTPETSDSPRQRER